MTEVPEHLLRRARERRAALTGGGAPAPAAGDEAPAPAAAAPATTDAAPAPAAAPAAPAAPATPAIAEPPALPPEIALTEEKVRRTRVPMWMTPVLLVLPFWAILYAGAFGDRTHEEEHLDPLQLGAEIYRSAGCASCHGATGEGGVGPALAEDDVEQTFPDPADHAEWIRTGSIGSPAEPTPYGDPNRPGGQRMSRGGMPSFAGQLSEEEIQAVVQYEREGL